MMKKIGILVPVFNEEAGIGKFISEFEKIINPKKFTYEFYFVNDGSSDKTQEVILKAKEQGRPLRLISLAENYGQHIALYAGLDLIDSDFDYIIIIDADLQNHPKYAIKIIDYMIKNNYDIVYGVRDRTSIGYGFMTKIFWSLICGLSSLPMPKNQSSLKVLNKTFLNRFKKIKKRPVFLPAALALIKANVGHFPIATNFRKFGKTKYNIINKLSLFFTAVFSVISLRSIKSEYRVKKIYD